MICARGLLIFGVLLLSGYGYANNSSKTVSSEKTCRKTDKACGVVACYYGSWSITRPGIGSFGVGDIEPNLCTHVYYSFLGPYADGSIHFLDAEQTINGKSNKLSELVAHNKNIGTKSMISLGGWSAGSTNFTIVANDPVLRAKLVDNLYEFLVKHKLDGANFDWEYPNQRGGKPEDKEGFLQTVKAVKEKFGDKLELSAAVAVTQNHIDLSYDVPELNKYLDYIHVMAYDLHGSWDNMTGVNAPLFDQTTDPKDQPNLTVRRETVDSAVKLWIKNGASPKKLVLGLANYGKTYTLASKDNTDTGAPISGNGKAGPITQAEGTWAYYEICADQKANRQSWHIHEVKGNYVYAYKDLFWVGYDNPHTIQAKAEYAKKTGLAGIIYWSIDQDDFSGACGAKYPLIKAGRKGLCKAH